MTLEDHVSSFKDLKILVVGDVMLDKYVFGKVTRVSPEGPVPILEVTKVEYRPGGAANVAYNANSLGANTFLLGIINNKDEYGNLLEKAVHNSLVRLIPPLSDGRKTSCKERLIEEEHSHRLLRVDYEDEEERKPIPANLFEEIFYQIENYSISSPFNCIVLSDYDKGMFKSDLAKRLIEFARRSDIPVIAGPKPNNIESFAYSTVICINQKEAGVYTGKKYNGIESLEYMAKTIEERLHPEHVIITCGKDGMFIYDAGNHIHIPPKVPIRVFDVTGAGDTVLATLALALSSKKYNIMDAAKIANLAAGVVVEQVGTVAVKPEELSDRIQNQDY